jgi:hypothetical protein
MSLILRGIFTLFKDFLVVFLTLLVNFFICSSIVFLIFASICYWAFCIVFSNFSMTCFSSSWSLTLRVSWNLSISPISLVFNEVSLISSISAYIYGKLYLDQLAWVNTLICSVDLRKMASLDRISC